MMCELGGCLRGEMTGGYWLGQAGAKTSTICPGSTLRASLRRS